MTKQAEKVIKIIANYFDIDSSRLILSTDFIRDLEAEESDLLNINELMEDRFALFMTERLETVQEYIDYVAEYAGNAK